VQEERQEIKKRGGRRRFPNSRKNEATLRDQNARQSKCLQEIARRIAFSPWQSRSLVRYQSPLFMAAFSRQSCGAWEMHGKRACQNTIFRVFFQYSARMKSFAYLFSVDIREDSVLVLQATVHLRANSAEKTWRLESCRSDSSDE
jgi:hypothetical protein